MRIIEIESTLDKQESSQSPLTSWVRWGLYPAKR